MIKTRLHKVLYLISTMTLIFGLVFLVTAIVQSYTNPMLTEALDYYDLSKSMFSTSAKALFIGCILEGLYCINKKLENDEKAKH